MFQQWVTRSPRVAAGAWFTIVGCVPVSLWVLPSIIQKRDVTALVLIILLPLAATGLSGAWLGAAVLQRRLGRLRAFLQGMGVALGTFILLVPLYGLASVVMEPKTIGSLGEILVQTFLAIAVGLLVTGWLFIPLGGVAGLLLRWMARRGG